MAVIKATEKDIRTLAQLMRAEAEGEGDLGMLMVGNVGVNRVRSNCLDFRGIRTIPQMVFQSPGGFESTQKSYFYQHPRESEMRLARKVVQGQRYDPATNALWFFRPTGECPAQWYNQPNAGRYKAHCFFQPEYSNCPTVFGTY